MKPRQVIWILVVLLATAFQASAQLKDDARKLFEVTKAKAEKGAAEAQVNLGWMYANGQGVAKDEAEAVRWYRKAADQGVAVAQFNLGLKYDKGEGVAKDEVEALRWYRKAADQGFPYAQYNLGLRYANGQGVAKDPREALKWFRKAADQNNAPAQSYLGVMYLTGSGTATNLSEAQMWLRKAAENGLPSAQFNLGSLLVRSESGQADIAEGVRWFKKAAEQGDAGAQSRLAGMLARGEGIEKDSAEAARWYQKAAASYVERAERGDLASQLMAGDMYSKGVGVLQDLVESFKWFSLVAAGGYDIGREYRDRIARQMTPEQIAQGQRLAREFKSRNELSSEDSTLPENPLNSGTGFCLTKDGYFVTNEHVVRGATQIRLVTSAGLISAKVVKVDAANDLALLKAEGRFAALPVAASRTVKLGGTVATVGFPNIGLQGFAPKLARGEIASLSGAQDDARYFQISVPVQPGNSGGALVDERGNVVGVVSAKLSARAALSATGALPENVNYAVKSSYLLSFLESVPEVSAKLKEPETKERKFEDVVKSAEQAAVLVLVY